MRPRGAACSAPIIFGFGAVTRDILDGEDLLKTVDKHGTECCHVLSRSSRFLAVVLVERGPILPKKRLKTLMTRLDRQERIIPTYQNIRIQHHCLLQPIFSMFPHHFFSVFGLFTIAQPSVETSSRLFPRHSRPFLHLSHQNSVINCEFRRSLVNHHRKIPLQHIFCSCKWKGHTHDQFWNTLTQCAAVQHMPVHGRRTAGRDRVEKEAETQALQQMLGDSSAALLTIASSLLRAPIDGDIFGYLLWDELIGLNACSDSIDDLLLV